MIKQWIGPVILFGVILVILAVLVLPKSKEAQASRLMVQGGDLYRATDVIGSRRITNNKDIQVLFGESNKGLVLFGSGVVRESDSPHMPVGTQLKISRADGLDERTVTETADVATAFFDRNSENVMFLTTAGDIYRYRVSDGKKERVAKEASIPDMSPDGLKLVYQKAPPGWTPGQYFEGSPGLVILDLATQNEKTLAKHLDSSGSSYYAPMWTPDGNHVVAFADGLYIMNADGSEQTQLTNKPGSYAESGAIIPGISDDPLWSSDGKYFLYHSDNVIWLLHLDIPGKRLVYARPIAEGVQPRWVKEGESISVLNPMARTNDSALTVVDLTGKVLSGDKTKGSRSPLLDKQRIMPTPPVDDTPREAKSGIPEKIIPREVPPEVVKVLEKVERKNVPADAFKAN